MLSSPRATAARVLALSAVVGVLSPLALARDEGWESEEGPNAIHGFRTEIHAAVDRYNMFGVGARLEFPVVREGFLGPNVQDELALSLGADFLFSAIDRNYYDGGGYVIPIGAVQWNFYLGDRWSVFPEAGIALHLGFYEGGYQDHARLYIQPDLGVGARLHLDDRFALLMRVSTPGGLQLGLVF